MMAKISPDGEFLAPLAPDPNARQLVVLHCDQANLPLGVLEDVVSSPRGGTIGRIRWSAENPTAEEFREAVEDGLITTAELFQHGQYMLGLVLCSDEIDAMESVSEELAGLNAQLERILRRLP